MDVKIVYFGPIKSYVGVEEEVIPIKNEKTTVRHLIEEIAHRHGDEIKNLCIHGTSSNRGVNIFVNGRHILENEDLETVVEGGSEVNIILVSQAAGG